VHCDNGTPPHTLLTGSLCLFAAPQPPCFLGGISAAGVLHQCRGGGGGRAASTNTSSSACLIVTCLCNILRPLSVHIRAVAAMTREAKTLWHERLRLYRAQRIMCVVLAYLSRVKAVQSLHDALPRSGWTDQHAQRLWQAGDTEIVFLLSLISQIHAAGLLKPRLLRGARNVFRRVLETKATCCINGMIAIMQIR
jgi:hypothetical protein